MANILLITRTYPSSGVAEKNFVLPELVEHIKAGNRITIMPLEIKGAIDADLPESITILPDLAAQFTPRHFPRHLFRALCRADTWRELCAFPAPEAIISTLKFIIKAQCVTTVLNHTAKDFDIIYTYWCTGETLGALWYKQRSAAAPDLKIISRAHGYDIIEDRAENGGRIPFRTFVMRHLDKMICLSVQAKDYLAARYGTSGDKIIISPLGVENQEDAEPPPLTPQEITLISCSFPHPVKRLALIYEIAETLAATNPALNVTWTHYGADKHNLPFTIHNSPANLTVNLKGVTAKPVFLQDYKAASTPVFVNWSASEGQPVSVMEAMSCAIPVIATDVGGVSELIGDGGIVLDKDTPPATAAAHIHKTISDPALYKALGQNALQRQQTYYNQQNNHFNLAILVKNLNIL